MESNLIPILILLPIVGALITLFATPKNNPKASCGIAFILSLIPLALVVYIVATFPNLAHGNDSKWYFNFEYNWIPRFGIKFLMGMDTISLWLIVFTAFLTPIAILASPQLHQGTAAEFYAWMLALHAGMLGVFVAKDLLVFYLFFEFTLIPMFFIIGIWGGSERRRLRGNSSCSRSRGRC